MKVMVKTLLTLLGAFTVLTSCMNSYNIEGSSNVPTLDGRMLFLKVYEGNDMKTSIRAILFMVSSVFQAMLIQHVLPLFYG